MQNIKDEYIMVQKELSKVNMDFLEFIQKNPKAIKASSYKILDLNDKLFVLQPWPTFVNRTNQKLFEEASVKLFELIKSIPKRIFGNNFEKISSYYSIPLDLVKLHLDGVTDELIQNLFARGDFLLSRNGLKCLEFNVSANLGGWYVPLWEKLYLNTPIIMEFIKRYGVEIKNKNLIHSAVNHIFNFTYLNNKNNKKERKNDSYQHMNVVFIARDFAKYVDKMGVYLNKLYQDILKEQSQSMKQNLAGEVFMTDYAHLEIRDNQIFFRGKKIETVIEMYNGVVSPEVLGVFRAGNVGLLNGPITDLLSSKLNLALLSDYQSLNEGMFSLEEKAVIDKYIPWSRKVVVGDTFYRGEKVNLEKLILSEKDNFVLKPSVGYGGKGVYIGRRTDEIEWKQLINKAFNENRWLVQEYIEALPTVFQTGEEGYELHDLVWGFFVLGSQYSGSWARVLPQKDNKGVINCHQGATVSVNFEVDD